MFKLGKSRIFTKFRGLKVNSVRRIFLDIRFVIHNCFTEYISHFYSFDNNTPSFWINNQSKYKILHLTLEIFRSNFKSYKDRFELLEPMSSKKYYIASSNSASETRPWTMGDLLLEWHKLRRQGYQRRGPRYHLQQFFEHFSFTFSGFYVSLNQ